MAPELTLAWECRRLLRRKFVKRIEKGSKAGLNSKCKHENKLPESAFVDNDNGEAWLVLECEDCKQYFAILGNAIYP